MGRKTSYNINTFPLLAENYARNGLNDVQIAKKLNISIQTYYTYQNKYVEFFEAIKRGKKPVDIEVKNALLKRAKGYQYEEKHTEIRIDAKGNPKPAVIKTIIKTMAPDVGAICFWLKNRIPEEWRDKTEFEEINKTPIVAITFDKDE